MYYIERKRLKVCCYLSLYMYTILYIDLHRYVWGRGGDYHCNVATHGFRLFALVH